MDKIAFKKAYDNLFYSLLKHGYSKEAIELQSINAAATSTMEAPPIGTSGRKNFSVRDLKPESQNFRRFQEERPPQETRPNQDVYKGQPGSAAPVMQLSQIIDRIEGSPSFKKLPPNVIQGILKIKKMTSNAFKFASEKEAFLGGKKDTVRELQKFLLNFDKKYPDKKSMPENVKRALYNLNMLVTQHVDSLPPEKTLLEKGKDVAQGIGEKGKDIARGVAEKGQQLKQDWDQKREKAQDLKREEQIKRKEEQDVSDERQQVALTNLKKSLFNYKTYSDIFYRLPTQIIRELNKIGLGMDDIKGLATVKVAHHVNRALLSYFKTKDAYSAKELNMGKKEEFEHLDVYETFAKVFKRKNIKAPMTKEQFAVAVAKAHLKEDPKYYTKLKKTFNGKDKDAMDFSGIGNLITPEGALDERELSRVIRLAIAAELDAIHLYELIVDSSDKETIRSVLQDIANEEKVHVGELQELLKKFDKDSEKFLEEGAKEVTDKE